MSTSKGKDGTKIYYKDWGSGPVVTFSHGWPLSADAWDGQLHFMAQNGFRVIAHDRRGHGRSDQAWSGNDVNGYADDLDSLIEALALNDVILVGHSTGVGEVARYVGRHGTKRVAAAVLIAAVPPIMMKSLSCIKSRQLFFDPFFMKIDEASQKMTYVSNGEALNIMSGADPLQMAAPAGVIMQEIADMAASL